LKKQILFITTNNLVTNPRCLKEIKLAIEEGYSVTVIKFQFNNWTAMLEAQIEQSLPLVSFIKISAGKTPLFPWLISSLLNRISFILFPFSSLNNFFTSVAIDKRSYLLTQQLNEIADKPDIIIAHNPGAFFPAMKFSAKRKIPFGIDMEDYHPGEANEVNKRKIVSTLLQRTLPSSSYITYAAPLIKMRTEEELGTNLSRGTLINNCFSRAFFKQPEVNETAKVKLVWFSQNIDFGRGLEDIIPVLDKYKDQVVLTLIGNLRLSFQEYLKNYSWVTTMQPMLEKELYAELKNFDVGLAIEAASTNENRDLCLTNKIWCYFQSGLFILGSSTKAQERFLDEHKSHGQLFQLTNAADLEKKIASVVDNIQSIRNKSVYRYNNAAKHSWNEESRKLSNLWKEVLN
jgi:hypothetical protein